MEDAKALNRRGWERLCQGCRHEAMEDFSRAIELDPDFAEAYSNRSIAKQIAGEDAAEDEAMANALTSQDPEAHMILQQQRKWMCVGYNTRGEPEGEKTAVDADFLISFASPDRNENNRILHEVKTGVYYDGSLRPVTFCTDKSLGMGLHIKEGQEMRRWKPIFSDLDQDLDQPRQPGEYPPWFKHYKEAAKKTKHGLLILQLTDSYLKSKACRWEFGYVRKPELVHVYVPSGDKSPGRIVKWEELMEDAELCKQLFGEALGRTFQANLDAEDPTMQGTFTQLEKMAETAEEQEHQAWCELPFRQLAYNFAANTFGEESVTTMPSADNLIAVFNQTGFAAKAEQIGKDLLERKENQFGKDHFFVATTLALLGSAHGDLGNYSQQKDLLERALRILEQRYGKDHPEVALTLASLGNAHGDLGNYSQQKDLFERALRIKEQHYGKEHPEVAKTLTNLSNAHGYLGYYSQQKDLLEHALRIKEQHYGKEHPEVAVTLTNLGNAHGSLGDYSQQKDLLERALRIKEQHFGKEHPEVAITVYNLGEAHDDLGDLRRAKELVERAFKIFVHHGSPYAERAQRRLAQMEVKMMPSVRPSVPRGFVEAVRRSTQDGEDLQKALALSLETVEDNEDLQKALALSEPLEDVEDPELREDLALSVSPLHAGS